MSAQLERLPDWDLRLVKFIEARASQPFEWGKADCATLAADAIRASTGVDVMNSLRGGYDNLRDAVRVAHGPTGDFLELVHDIFRAYGIEVAPGSLLGRGDIGVTTGIVPGHRPAFDVMLCVGIGDGFLAQGLRGLVVLSESAKPMLGWKVG